MTRPKNVLWIMCDQLRYDYLGCTGHPTGAGDPLRASYHSASHASRPQGGAVLAPKQKYRKQPHAK